MGTIIQKDSVVKNVLKNLCCSYGWNYGVFWRFDQRNSLLLTVQDAYFEEKIGGLIDDLLLQVHMLGGGIIGQAAFTKNHRWILSDDHYRGQIPLAPDQNIFPDDSEFHRQFSSGIKTIAVISVEPQGVVEFGSTEKILERTDFVNQTKMLFREINNCRGPESLLPSPSNCQSCGLFASLISSEHSQFTGFSSVQGSSLRDPIGTTSSSSCSMTPFSFTSDHRRMPLSFENSSHANPQLDQPIFLVNSTLDSFKQPASELRALEQPWNGVSAKPNESFLDSSFTSSLNATPDMLMMQDFTIPDEFFQNVPDISNSSHWLSPLPDQSNITLSSTLNDDLLSQAMGFAPISVPIDLSANSLQSSVTKKLNADGNCKVPEISGIEVDVLGNTEDWGNILMPVLNDSHLDVHSYTSECIGNKNINDNSSTVGPSNGLFSKLGIKGLLESVSGISNNVSTSSYLEDQGSSISKRRKTGNSIWDIGSLQPAYSCLGPKVTKSEPGLWISDDYSMNGRSSVSQAKSNVESAKPVKKKAKPGTRPRPKDRQQILDRMAELRELIPNGEKMSIDCLLDRTIKHMLFLQSVTKHADRLKKVDESKGHGIGSVQKNYSTSSSSNGVTWACEFGSQTMICPLIVEDLSTPGQMLIEMLCEEQGFFLEIVDVIRGFGLTILKGVMEVREDKIWARFIVETEANKHVTRLEIFSALVQLLQASCPINDQLDKVTDEGTSLLNSYQQSVLPIPVSLGETLHCIKL